MDNLTRWRIYTRDLVSPDNYIDMGYYYLIAAALQRRIWYGPDYQRLFPNVYFVFVGDAGVGKGLVLGRINYFLRYFERKDRAMADAMREVYIATEQRIVPPDGEHPALVNGARQLEEPTDAKAKIHKPKLLFPVAADNTTFEALCRAFADATCTIPLPDNLELAPTGKYIYKSLSFCLEELSSLLGSAQKAEKIADFFLCAFDCKDYEYDTKHQGTDLLRKPCLNFAAGTTPVFMQRAFSSAILSDGFCARCIFVYEFSNRHNKFKAEDLDEEQKNARINILRHIYKLSSLVGRVQLTDEAEAFCKHYFEVDLPRGTVRVNKSLKLNSYYARKKVHTLKMAMLVHFADHYDMIITLSDVKTALRILDGIEGKMHYALTFGGNPLANIQKSIIKHLKEAARYTDDPVIAGRTFKELWIEFSDDVRELELQECLKYCVATSLIKTVPHPTLREDLFLFSPPKATR